jgi:hypothetical protein
VQVRHDDRLVGADPDLLRRPPSSWSPIQPISASHPPVFFVDNGLAASNPLRRMPTAGEAFL